MMTASPVPPAGAASDEAETVESSTNAAVDASVDMFSPRSAAAMALSSISRQPPAPATTMTTKSLFLEDTIPEEHALLKPPPHEKPEPGKPTSKPQENQQQPPTSHQSHQQYYPSNSAPSADPAVRKDVTFGDQFQYFHWEQQQQAAPAPAFPPGAYPLPPPSQHRIVPHKPSVVVGEPMIPSTSRRYGPPPSAPPKHHNGPPADFLPPWTPPTWTQQKHQQQQQPYTNTKVSWEHPPPPHHYEYPGPPPPMHYYQVPSSGASVPHMTRPYHPGIGTTVTPTPHKKQKVIHASSSSSGRNVYHRNHLVPLAVPPKGKTPAKPKYNRKKKSLGVLAETFLAKFTGKTSLQEPCQQLMPPSQNKQETAAYTDIVIDRLATDLAVERRRIYDVVNILEALQLVVKKGKNTYQWMGQEHLSRQFALLQNEAILLWPEHAAMSGLFPNRVDAAVPLKDNKNKSLTKLSQLFLQVFLVGMQTVSLPHASDLINGGASTMHDLAVLGCKPGEAVPTDPKLFQQAAARGLKTKIRRLYDIANVFLSVGLLSKIEDKAAKTAEAKRPRYSWNYGLSVTQIRDVWISMPAKMKDEKTPFSTPPLAAFESSAKNRFSRPLPFGSALTLRLSSSSSTPTNGVILPTMKMPAATTSHTAATPSMPPPPSATATSVSRGSSELSTASAENSSSSTAAKPSQDDDDNVVLRNIHQTGGAVLSAEKEKELGRVSLQEGDENGAATDDAVPVI